MSSFDFIEFVKSHSLLDCASKAFREIIRKDSNAEAIASDYFGNYGRPSTGGVSGCFDGSLRNFGGGLGQGEMNKRKSSRSGLGWFGAKGQGGRRGSEGEVTEKYRELLEKQERERLGGSGVGA